MTPSDKPTDAALGRDAEDLAIAKQMARRYVHGVDDLSDDVVWSLCSSILRDNCLKNVKQVREALRSEQRLSTSEASRLSVEGERDELRKELEAAQDPCRQPCADAGPYPRSPWQPIETAPKDGTMFLAWREVPTYDEDARRTVNIGEPCVAQSLWGSVGSIPLHYQPAGQRLTHWMPLPPPPLTGEGDA